jgi:hypothetical protein
MDTGVSLQDLQRAVLKWHTSSGLLRIKGNVLVGLGSTSCLMEFQFSGRTRLQCTRAVDAVVSTTRLAVVSRTIADFDVLSSQAGLKPVLASSSPFLDNTYLTEVPQDDEGYVKFRITALRKFGFTEAELLLRFGCDLYPINDEFQATFNALSGPELVAFDGKYLYITSGEMDQAKFLKALDSVTEAHFAVVKRACRCDV